MESKSACKKQALISEETSTIIGGLQYQKRVKVHVVSSQSSFGQSVKTALRLANTEVYDSTAEAVDQIRDAIGQSGMVVLDLTSVSEADRLIHFLKWSPPTNHVPIIGVGYDSDFTGLEPGARRLLDVAVKAPFTRFQLAAAAAAALSVRSEELRA